MALSLAKLVILLANNSRTMSKLNHFNEAGAAHMVDVGDKAVTSRKAVAQGRISMQPETLQRIIAGDHGKGDVLGVARVAGIMAAKKTAELVPLCHPIALTHVDIVLQPDPSSDSVLCEATVETQGVTGVEMEALTAVQISLLTIYDMCKGVDKGMEIGKIRLLEKKKGEPS